jgi:TatD DNase family protein
VSLNPMIIDTHAHVNFAAFKEDAESTVKRALDEGVWVVNVGTQIDTSREAVAMADKFEKGVYAVIGIHPVHTYSQELDEEETHFKTREESFDYDLYKSLAQNPKVVGIGECGLDYFRLPENGDHQAIKKTQAEAFIAQLKLAKELDKALVIHSRSSKGTDDACLDILEILKQDLALSPKPYPLRFVLHSYTGSPEVAKKFVDLGAYISFNGIITFDKTGNQEAVLKVVPDDKILLETDCPYLTPVPMRGKRNEPSYVRFVAEHIAKLKGLSVDEAGRLTTGNAKRFFQI